MGVGQKKSMKALEHRASMDAYIYRDLATRERDSDLRGALSALADLAGERAAFWQEHAAVAASESVSRTTCYMYRALRFVLGATLTAKYLSARERDGVKRYIAYCATCTSAEDRSTIELFAQRATAIIESMHESRVAFFSNIVLGFNDALIELTGALVGFSFAMRDTNIVIVAGLVTGVSASLSMAASAFQQARHEAGRKPTVAALFTGVSYFSIALLLVLPFVLFETMQYALAALGVVVLALVAIISIYSSLLLERRYWVQFAEMCVFSLGVAVIAFAVGHSLSVLLGV